MGHTHLQSFEKESHNDTRDDEKITDDGGRSRTAEEVAQEETEDNLSVTPEEEGQDKNCVVSLERGEREWRVRVGKRDHFNRPHLFKQYVP